MRPTFYYHPRMLAYDFGPQHPFRPERLELCVELLSHYGIQCIDPGVATEEDALRVHSKEYIETFKEINKLLAGLDDLSDQELEKSAVLRHGFASGDNPPFVKMWQASLNFIAG